MGSLPQIVESLGILQVYSDGSIVRPGDIEFNIPVHDDGSVLWKDCLYDKTQGLYLRLYKPVAHPTTSTKLPIVFFIHGGGFCVGSRTWPNCHNCCFRLSSGLQALVVAPDYRLAPEHRLPAAMDDSVGVVKWLQSQALSQSPDTWLCDGVDFDRVFIMGDSSGGNIAHHLAVRFSSDPDELAPLGVCGYVLLAPFFGGTVRTKSEAGPSEPILNLDILDRFWRLSLPVGGTADHPFANPFGPESPSLEPVRLAPILVVVGGSEMLKDRVEDYAKRLKELGKKIEYVVFEGKQHGFFTNEPYSEDANRVLSVIESFMSDNSA